jgi:hypothetical protein
MHVFDFVVFACQRKNGIRNNVKYTDPFKGFQYFSSESRLHFGSDNAAVLARLQAVASNGLLDGVQILSEFGNSSGSIASYRR